MNRTTIAHLQTWNNGKFNNSMPSRSGVSSTVTDGKTKRIIRLYLTSMLLLALMFTVYIWQSTKMVEVKLRIQQTTKRLDSLEMSNTSLKAEISSLQSLSRIESVAKNNLGMIVPTRRYYLPVVVSHAQ